MTDGEADLHHVYEDVDGGVDCQHQVVEPTEDLCPGRPVEQVPVVDDLVGLVTVGDHLGGVAEEEHEDDGGEERGHGVPPVCSRDPPVDRGLS